MNHETHKHLKKRNIQDIQTCKDVINNSNHIKKD